MIRWTGLAPWEFDAEPQPQDGDGNHPLAWAVSRGHKSTVTITPAHPNTKHHTPNTKHQTLNP